MSGGMICFRLVFWGIVLIVLMLPGAFLVGIIGRIAGFRPGTPPGPVEKVFGWFGIIVLGGIMLGMCLIAGLIDWGIATIAENGPGGFQPPNNINLVANPRPIPANWNDANMQKTFLSDLQEFNARVGWGTFGKTGRLGYHVGGSDVIRVNAKPYSNAISMHPPSRSFSTVSYQLGRNQKIFQAWAALNDTEGWVPDSAATFAAFGDGVCLWVSQPNNRAGTMEECRINVEGVDVMELQVHCPGHHGNVRGVWLEPHLFR
jgi:NPCBM/NEW2 domain